MERTIEDIEEDLWDYLDDAKEYLHNDEFEKDNADMHYLSGKVEGLEEAIAVVKNLEDIKDIYKDNEKD